MVEFLQDALNESNYVMRVSFSKHVHRICMYLICHCKHAVAISAAEEPN